MARLVGDSGLDGRRGVIGVLWNGGGALVSRTTHEGAAHQFARVIDQVVERYGGDRRWIVMFGGSRGGVTALTMASNPYGHNYRVVLVAAWVPPTRMGDIVQLVSPTYPGLLHGAGSTPGLADAWRTGWTYPSCGRPELVGLDLQEVALDILTNTRDPEAANDLHSVDSELFLEGLLEAGTQVHLEIGEHDDICPFAHQARYAATLWRLGVPVDVRVMVRGGHGHLQLPGHPPEHEILVSDAVRLLTDPAFNPSGPVPELIEPGFSYYRVDRASGQFEEFSPAGGLAPFSVDLPYIVARGQRVPVVAVGEPGTAWRVTYSHGGVSQLVLEGVVGDLYYDTRFVDILPDFSALPFDCSLEIRRPGAAAWTPIPTTGTPTGNGCNVRVMEEEPPIDYGAAYGFFHAPTVTGHAATGWGLSEY
jgi:predicted esterase